MDSDRIRTAGYIRVSLEKQADNGISLEAQKARIEAYAELYGLDVIAVDVDAGESAKPLDREGLQRALGRLETGEAEALLIVKLDRLTRSVRDLGLLLEQYFSNGTAYTLMSVNENLDTRTASGRLVLNVLASVSQWERETIGERTSEALKHKASIGEYTGGIVPYGYVLSRDGVRLTPNPDEQKVIKRAIRLRKRGYSLRAIAEALVKDGYLNRSGRIFNPTAIKKMLAA